jgi:S1-C subfamily serine protease
MRDRGQQTWNPVLPGAPAVPRSWIGVQIQPVTAEIADGLGMKDSDGAVVVEPQAGSPAAKAGIMTSDVITAVNGSAVNDPLDLARLIGAMAPAGIGISFGWVGPVGSDQRSAAQ